MSAADTPHRANCQAVEQSSRTVRAVGLCVDPRPAPRRSPQPTRRARNPRPLARPVGNRSPLASPHVWPETRLERPQECAARSARACHAPAVRAPLRRSMRAARHAQRRATSTKRKNRPMSARHPQPKSSHFGVGSCGHRKHLDRLSLYLHTSQGVSSFFVSSLSIRLSGVTPSPPRRPAGRCPP